MIAQAKSALARWIVSKFEPGLLAEHGQRVKHIGRIRCIVRQGQTQELLSRLSVPNSIPRGANPAVRAIRKFDAPGITTDLPVLNP